MASRTPGAGLGSWGVLRIVARPLGRRAVRRGRCPLALEPRENHAARVVAYVWVYERQDRREGAGCRRSPMYMCVYTSVGTSLPSNQGPIGRPALPRQADWQRLAASIGAALGFIWRLGRLLEGAPWPNLAVGTGLLGGGGRCFGHSGLPLPGAVGSKPPLDVEPAPTLFGEARTACAACRSTISTTRPPLPLSTAEAPGWPTFRAGQGLARVAGCPRSAHGVGGRTRT